MVALVAAAFAAGGLVGGGDEVPGHGPEGAGAAADQATVWTCAMHPQIQLPNPGKCPICFMDLIPLESHEEEAPGPRELSVSEHAAALMEVDTAPVERRFVDLEVRMVGKVAYDETRLAAITAWVPGRLERLFVDYTGVTVRQGDHLVELYSPELLSAQEELLQAVAVAQRLAGSSIPASRRTAEATASAAREKLRQWGLTEAQIGAVEERGEASDRVTIHAPSGGIVVHMNAREGMYVQTGTQIYTIADLSRVWVELDAYESDLPWVRYGHEVEFTTEAHPGRTFHGTISFIQPVLDEATRTVKVRVNVDNPSLELKPGMFVRARVQARIAEGGRVVGPSLAGKWIGPMHPEVLKDGPGTCDVCGMALVRAEELGYVSGEPVHAPLVIPDTAPLITGKRAVVYVEVPGRDRPTYEGREITLGPRAGGYYVVREGLTEGERVVTHGAFKLDAELQIRARPSMMSPAGGAPIHGHGHHGASRGAASGGAAEVPGAGAGAPDPGQGAAHGASGHNAGGHSADGTSAGGHNSGYGAGGRSPADHMPESGGSSSREGSVDPVFAAQLGGVVTAYLDIQVALAGDEGGRAASLARPALEALEGVDMALAKGDDHMAWMAHADSLRAVLERLAEAGDVGAARQHFGSLSEEMLALIQRFGAPDQPLYQAYCPMAFDFAGATWIQGGEEISNPYFGAAMLRCGTVQEVLE